MNKLHEYQQELNEILYLKDVKEMPFRYSNTLLFREYRFRLFSWKSLLNNDDLHLFNKRRSFHNLFNDLSPSWIDQVIPEEKLIEDLNNNGFDLSTSFRNYNVFFIAMFLNWKLFNDTLEIQKFSNLPNPYEPAFKIISRGGTIFYHEGTFIIDGRDFLNYKMDFRLPSLDEKFLNYIDQNCNDYPNQQLVDELWQKFQES